MSVQENNIKNLASIPEECSINIPHVQIHLKSAEDAYKDKDLDQAAHDFDLAGRILQGIAYKIDLSTGKYD